MNGAIEVQRIRDLRRFQARLLMAWSIGSMLIGLPMWFLIHQKVFLNAAGSQFFIWGAIDAVFAALGLRQAANTVRTAVNDVTIPVDLADRDKLVRFLHFNQYLNYLWVGIGLALLATGLYFNNNTALLGHGMGVTLQGGFLFVADWWFVRRLMKYSHGTDPAPARTF